MASAGIGIDVLGLKEVQAAIKKAPRAFDDALLEEIQKAVRIYEREVKRRASGGKAKFGKSIKVRSGQFRASIQAHVDKQQKSGIVKSDIIYAKTLEFGDPNRKPKRAKFLAIPLDAAKTKAGVTRMPPRKWPDTFVARSRAGHLIIFQKRGKGKPLALFVLKRSVRIKARAPFRRTQSEKRPEVKKSFEDRMKKTTREIFGRN